MKSLISFVGAVAVLGALPIFAHADVSDSGNLVIGGTATISGLDANGYSIRASSGITLGGCVQFGDGSQQCAAGNAGSAVKAGTQTFSGANTFYSTTTIKGVANWEWLVFSTRVVSGTTHIRFSTITLTNYLQPDEADSSSIPWHLKFSCYLSSAGASYALIFNNDNGALYNYILSRVTGAGVGGVNCNTSNCKWMSLQDYSAGNTADSIGGDFYFVSEFNNSNRVTYWGSGSQPSAGGALLGPAGQYAGTSILTKVALTSSVVATATAQADQKMPINCMLWLFRGPGPNQIGNP